MRNSYKGLGHVPHMHTPLSLGHQKKRIVALRKFRKSITLRLACGFSQLLLLSALIKQASFHVLEEKQLYEECLDFLPLFN